MTTQRALTILMLHTALQRARQSTYRWRPMMDATTRHRPQPIVFVAAADIQVGEIVHVSAVQRDGRSYVAPATRGRAVPYPIIDRGRPMGGRTA